MRRRHVTHKARVSIALACFLLYVTGTHVYFARKARRRPKPVEIRTEVETRVSSDGSEPRVGSRKMNDDDKREIRRETKRGD